MLGKAKILILYDIDATAAFYFILFFLFFFFFLNYRYPFIHILGGESDTFSFDDTTTRSFLDIVDSFTTGEAEM